MIERRCGLRHGSEAAFKVADVFVPAAGTQIKPSKTLLRIFRHRFKQKKVDRPHLEFGFNSRQVPTNDEVVRCKVDGSRYNLFLMFGEPKMDKATIAGGK